MDPRVAEAVWKAIQGHLPPRPPDLTRWAATGCASRTGTAWTPSWPGSPAGCCWDVAARLCKASETTLRARRTEWLAAGVFDKLVEEAIAGYDKIIAPGPIRGRRRRPACTKPRAEGEGTGPNPTDRAKIGWKWSRSALTAQPLPVSLPRIPPAATSSVLRAAAR